MPVDLRWKIGLLVGAILTILLSIYGLTQFITIEQRFNQMQASRFQELDRQMQRLIEQHVQRYQDYFTQKFSTHDLQKALNKPDTKYLKASMQSMREVSRLLNPWLAIHLYDNQGKLLIKEGDIQPDELLIKQSLTSNQPHWYSHCTDQCWLWVAFPISTKVGAVLTLALNSSSFLSEFESLTQTNTLLIASLAPTATIKNNQVNAGLDILGNDSVNKETLTKEIENSVTENTVTEDATVKSKTNNQKNQILSWKNSVSIYHQSAEVTGFLERIAFSYPLNALAKGVRYVDQHGRIFWLKSFGVNALLAENAQQMIIYFDDITETYHHQVWMAWRNLLYGLALWALLLPIFILMLWKPIENLKKLIEVMVGARNESSENLRKRLLDLKAPGNWVDEAQQLLPSVLMMIDQRIFVQRLMQQRTELLETRRIDLENEKDFVMSLLDTAHAVIVIQNSRGQIEMINRYGSDLAGKSNEQLVRTSFSNLLSYRDDMPDTRYQINELSKGVRNEFSHEAEFIRFDGKRVFMAMFHSRLPKNDEFGNKILTIALDISQRKQAEEYLAWLATHDALTGLVNRRHFVDELDKILKSAMRYGQSGAVLSLNLDQFKDVNDTSGHEVGDNLLKSVARVLRKQARDTDLVARLGGDEFAMILPQADELEAAETAEKVCSALNKIKIRAKNDFYYYVSASIGAVIFPQQGKNSAELLAHADMAMLHAKEAGRNCWRLFADDHKTRTRVNERVYWNEMVKRTLEEDSFEMYYQPIQNLRTKSISHFEALLRIFDDKNEAVSSQKFILSAENSGAIQELDMRIISRVFRHKAHLESMGIDVILAINLSGLSFKNVNLVGHIESLFQRYQINKKSIIFEITETAAVSDAQGTLEMMNIIKNSGYRFSLDDFGVGFSSLYYLKKFPFYFVKIDGSFVRNLAEDVDDQVLVKALVEVAQSFGQFTIAEYVETSECWALLKSLNVDYAQGYFIGKPVPAEQIWPQLSAANLRPNLNL